MRRLVLGLLPLFACTPSTSGQPTPQCEREDQCGVVQACLAGQCKDGPIVAALPPLPAPGGAGGVSVAVIQQASQLFTGNAAQGRVGDLLIKNRVSAFVIQQPGREIGPVLFGGNVVDAVPLAPDGTAGPDEFGEVAPLLNLGMGVDFKRWEIIRDGSDGGAAVVRLTGPVSQWDYVNLKAFLTDGFSALVPFDPAEPLAIKVVVTYELRPDEPVLRVTYALHNEGTSARQLPVGVVVDSGGAVEPFRSGGGFGKPSYNAASILEAAKSIPWFGFMGKQSTSAIRPRPVTGEAALDSANPTVQVAGVTVSLFSRPDVLAALAESDFYLRPNEAKSFGFDLAVGGPSLADASAALLRAQQRTTHPFNVTVRTVDNTPVAGPSSDRVLLFQDAALFPWLTVEDNVAFGLKHSTRAVDDQRQVARDWLARVHLRGFEGAYVHQLSGGMRQRVALARALATDPSMLLMDEPFGALDALTRDRLHEELESLWAATRKTVLFVTHNVREAVALGDRVLVFSPRPGRIVADVRVTLPRPRALEDVAVMQQAADLMKVLRRALDATTDDSLIEA